jgi:hypothetical protein
MPGRDTLIRIAEYFAVSTDYLLDKTEILHPPAPPGNENPPAQAGQGEGWDSAEGRQLLDKISSLPAEDRQKVLEYVALLAGKPVG